MSAAEPTGSLRSTKAASGRPGEELVNRTRPCRLGVPSMELDFPNPDDNGDG
jgi:hypothetical protein